VTGDARAERLRAVRAIVRHPGDTARPSVRSDINVTPLVDVVLVLLIIFMVVTPLIASGVAVDLPRTRHHTRSPDDGKTLVVSITADKRLYMGATRIDDVHQLAQRLTDAHRSAPDKPVFIKADARTPYGVARQLMQALHEANVDDVVLGTEELRQETLEGHH
jgi:biopolymer transport protein TolR